jgi:hypothetical protein
MQAMISSPAATCYHKCCPFCNRTERDGRGPSMASGSEGDWGWNSRLKKKLTPVVDPANVEERTLSLLGLLLSSWWLASRSTYRDETGSDLEKLHGAVLHEETRLRKLHTRKRPRPNRNEQRGRERPGGEDEP